MKVKKETKMVEQTITLYVAEDGKEFKSEHECRKYEEKKILESLIEKAEELRIKELDNCLPLTCNGLVNECNVFIWYKLESKEDFDIVESAYGYRSCFSKPNTYPEVMCVETCGFEPYEDDSYNYNMEEIKGITKAFWKMLGYNVALEK